MYTHNTDATEQSSATSLPKHRTRAIKPIKHETVVMLQFQASKACNHEGALGSESQL